MQITFTTSDFNHYNISCFGAKDGSITVNVSGGTPPYTYQWSNEQTTATITGLSADFHNVVVTDSTGESADFGVNLTSPDFLKPILTAYEYNNGYNISLYGASNGSITTIVDGGVSPFTFQWEDGPTTQNRSQLGGGFYVLQVTDANNCLANIQTILSEPERDDWTMGGNANTNPANNFIGTTDNKDLVFKTNGIERMRIGESGSIIMPQTTHFETIFTDRINTTSIDSVIHFGDSSLVMNPWQGTIFNDGLSFWHKGIGIGGVNSNFNNWGTAVGVAKNSVAIGNYVKAMAENAIAIGSGCLNCELWNSTPNSLYVGFNSDLPTLVVTPATGSGFTGEVGIGTAIVPTGYKLAVHGKILCEEVKVLSYTSWDEVFSPGYAMLTPKQLKEFISLNHHLPHIPSYKEMQKAEGISVGDFQMRMLRTVEEQAIYITKIDERMDKLEAENKALREQIKSEGNH